MGVGGVSVGDLTHGWRKTIAVLRDDLACGDKPASASLVDPIMCAGRSSIVKAPVTTNRHQGFASLDVVAEDGMAGPSGRQPKSGQPVGLGAASATRPPLQTRAPISKCDMSLADWPTAQDAAERIARLELELVKIREDVAHELFAVSDTQWRVQEAQDQLSALKAKASKLSERAATLSCKKRVLKTSLPRAAHMEGVQRRMLGEREPCNESPSQLHDRTMRPVALSVSRQSVK